jgi:hypothetical protein
MGNCSNSESSLCGSEAYTNIIAFDNGLGYTIDSDRVHWVGHSTD